MPVSCCLAGWSALALEPGDGGCRGMPTGRQGQAAEPTKPAMDQACRPSVGSGAGLVGGALAAGVGHAIYRPARSLHPGRGGRTRLPPRELLAARPRLSRQEREPGTQRWRRPPAWSSATADPRGRPPRPRGPGAAARPGRLVQQGQQLLPGGQLEQVDQPAGTVAQQHGALEALARKGADDGLAGGLGIGGSDPVAPGAVARPPQRPGELGTAPELEGRADRHLVGGSPLLAGELCGCPARPWRPAARSDMPAGASSSTSATSRAPTIRRASCRPSRSRGTSQSTPLR
jgi:hypothetical protein